MTPLVSILNLDPEKLKEVRERESQTWGRNGVKNIARIAKRCPENITLVVKCVKFLFPKVL